MSFAAARDAVRADVIRRIGDDVDALRALTREVPLIEADADRALVGGAVESVLRDAERALLQDATLSALLDAHESGIHPETGAYFDRAARAMCDASDSILEARYNSPWCDERDPVTTFEAAGGIIGAASPAEWIAHYRAHWSKLEHAAFIAARNES